MYVPTDLSISGPQLVKLYKGLPVQISKDGLQNCNSRCLMHPIMAKKVEQARKAGRGTRIVMSPLEIMQTGSRAMSGSGRMSGTGWWSDSWNWLKEKVPQAINWIKDTAIPFAKEVINSETYQSKLRPKVEGLIMDKLSGLPYADTTKDLAQAGFDYTGIGIKKPKKKGGAACQSKQKKITVGGSFRTS